MYEHAELRQVLPHRHPILLVDRMEEFTPFAKALTTKAISGSELCYAGLAGDAPTRAFGYPRTLMLESFCQSGALLWLRSAREAGEELVGNLVFAVARDVRFHGWAYPGDVLRNEVEIERVVAKTAFLRGRIWVGADLVGEVGSVVAAVRPELGTAADRVAPNVSDN